MHRAIVGIVAAFLLSLSVAACAPAAAPSPTAAPPKPTAAPAKAAQPATAAPKATAAPAKAAAPQAPAKPAGPPVTVTYGIPVFGTTTLQVEVGEKKGFFERENIKLDIVMTQSVPLIAQGLQGGSIQVGSLGPDSGIPAIEKGADIVFVAGVNDTADWTLIAQPDLKSYADLKGKPLGVATMKGGSSTVLQKMLLTNGLKEDDIVFVQAGGTSGRIAALESKAIAGGLISGPQNVMLAGKGYTVLGQVAEALPHYPTAGLAVTRAWAKNNEDVLLRVLRAHVASMNWLYDPANRNEGVKLLAEYVKVPEDVAGEVFDLITKKTKLFSPQGRFDLEGYRVVLQLLQEDGALSGALPDPKKYMDTQYLQKVGVNPPTR